MSKKDFFTTSELAKIMGISRIAVFNRIKNGKIKAIRIGRNWLIPKEEIEDHVGKELTKKEKELLLKGVHKVVQEYGETLKRLGKE